MPGDVKITVLPGISGQVIEGTILDPSTPPRMSHGIHGPLPHPSPVLPPSTPKGVARRCALHNETGQMEKRNSRGGAAGSGGFRVFRDSVAIHSGREVCRDDIRLSRWRGLLPDGNVLPRKCRMNQNYCCPLDLPYHPIYLPPAASKTPARLFRVRKYFRNSQFRVRPGPLRRLSPRSVGRRS